MKPGTLLVRADASPSIGSGHVMRCLALAQSWKGNGADVEFAMAASTPAIEQRLRDEGFGFASISGPAGSREDALSTRAHLEASSPAWMVLDGYCFGEGYRSEVEKSGVPCLAVDDNGGAQCFNSELVANQNAHAAVALYPKRSARTRLLLGPRYAMLRKEFAESKKRRLIAETSKRVLLTMGGSDPNHFAAKLLPHLVARLGSDVEIRVVAGGMSEPGNLERNLPERGSSVQVLRDVRNMADLMNWADLAIAGAGTTCWELCCMGLPAIVIEAADNQISLARKLDAMGVVVNAGPAGEVNCEKLADQAHQLLANHERRAAMSKAGHCLVDGRGTERVLAFMNSELRIRGVEPEDRRMLWEWANDPAVRGASFSSEPIPWESHKDWFQQQLASPQSKIYIIEKSREPVAEVRFQINGMRASLSIAVAREHRDQGLGAKTLLMGTEELFNTTKAEIVDAFVKPSNSRSLDLFRTAGFAENGESTVQKQPAIWFTLKRWGSSN
jgi:UDP-2,4-diacetamido-2,4,6-trideoxy-beta-L-altropyranose hydrolase